MNILDFESCYKFEFAKLMYQVSNRSIDEVIGNLFKQVRTVHKINTRQASAGIFAQPKARTNFKTKFISVMGVKIWNETPIEIRKAPTKSWLIDSF